MIKNLTTVVHQNVLLFYEIGMEVLALKVLYNNNLLFLIHLKNVLQPADIITILSSWKKSETSGVIVENG
jgi:hypothetical protein